MSLLSILDRYSALLFGVTPRTKFVNKQRPAKPDDINDKEPLSVEFTVEFRQKFYRTYSQVMINK